jgi:hypothetical protein
VVPFQSQDFAVSRGLGHHSDRKNVQIRFDLAFYAHSWRFFQRGLVPVGRLIFIELGGGLVIRGASDFRQERITVSSAYLQGCVETGSFAHIENLALLEKFMGFASIMELYMP